jgi:hypothetical protein
LEIKFSTDLKQPGPKTILIKSKKSERTFIQILLHKMKSIS